VNEHIHEKNCVRIFGCCCAGCALVAAVVVVVGVVRRADGGM